MRLYILTNLDFIQPIKDEQSIQTCLVAAKDEYSARLVHPMSMLNQKATPAELFFDHRNIWPYDLNRIGVTILGLTDKELPETCIGILQTADECRKAALLYAAAQAKIETRN